MIPMICLSNTDYQEFSTAEAVDLLHGESVRIYEKPFPFLSANRNKVFRLIFSLPKQKEFDAYVTAWHEERGATSSISNPDMVKRSHNSSVVAAGLTHSRSQCSLIFMLES